MFLSNNLIVLVNVIENRNFFIPIVAANNIHHCFLRYHLCIPKASPVYLKLKVGDYIWYAKNIVNVN